MSSGNESVLVAERRGRAAPRNPALAALHVNEHFVAVNKPADVRMDGEFVVDARTGARAPTVERLAQQYVDRLCEAGVDGGGGATNVRSTALRRVGHRMEPMPLPRVRMVHQLDYATSGVVLLGLQRRPTGCACRAFRERAVDKTYLALVHGFMRRTTVAEEAEEAEYDCVFTDALAESKHDFCVRIADTQAPRRHHHHDHHDDDDAANGNHRGSGANDTIDNNHDDDVREVKHAVTKCRIRAYGLYRGAPVTRVELRPETGRRHQLRVHLRASGHGIVGDATYPTVARDTDDAEHAEARRFPRMMLHAWKLRLARCTELRERYGLPRELVAEPDAEFYALEAPGAW